MLHNYGGGWCLSVKSWSHGETEPKQLELPVPTFDDNEQKRLKDFYAHLSAQGCFEMLSNSDCKGRNSNDNFLDELYKDFIIERVNAKRSINANASKRGILTELLIRNYNDCQGSN